MNTPTQLTVHSSKYIDNAWQQYTIAELGNFVHLLAKRSEHRSDVAKRQKDLEDARNYLRMIEAKLDALG